VAGPCRIRLLGGFAVEVDGRPLPASAWRHRRGADLVKLLALDPSHHLHREQVMDALWPELPPHAAAANLRKAVHYARRALGHDLAITTEGEMVRLWPLGELTVDAQTFAAMAKHVHNRDAALQAIALYGGELLPEDRYAAWTEPRRETLRETYLSLLRSEAKWEQVLEVDPTDEQAHRALMGAYLERGDRQAAMRQFERLRRRLRVDLGVGPERATVSLYERALALEGNQPPAPVDLARVLIARALVHWNAQELDEVQQLAKEAHGLAVHQALPRELGEASALLGLVGWATGTWREVFRAEFLEAVHRAPQLSAFVFDGHLCMAEYSLYGPDLESAADFATDLLKLADEGGSTRGRALATLLLGEAALLSGHLADAQESLVAARELHRAAGSSSGEVLSLIRLAETSLAKGRRARARRDVSAALALAEHSELAPHLVVRAWATGVAAEDGDKALDAVAHAEQALAGTAVCGPCSIGYRIAATRAMARVGDVPAAQHHLTEAERLAGLWQGGPWHAATWEARAAVRAAQGDRAQAAALLREAGVAFQRAGRPLDADRCFAAAG